jgi:hypothetical protein
MVYEYEVKRPLPIGGKTEESGAFIKLNAKQAANWLTDGKIVKKEKHRQPNKHQKKIDNKEVKDDSTDSTNN